MVPRSLLALALAVAVGGAWWYLSNEPAPDSGLAPGDASAHMEPGSGGALELADVAGHRARLTVPPGGLAEATLITASPAATSPSLPGNASVLAAFEFGPDGLRFETPARLMLTLADAAAVSGAWAFGYNATGVYPLPWTVEGDTLIVEIDHFSGAGAAEGDCSSVTVQHRPRWPASVNATALAAGTAFCETGGEDTDAILDILDKHYEENVAGFEPLVARGPEGAEAVVIHFAALSEMARALAVDDEPRWMNEIAPKLLDMAKAKVKQATDSTLSKCGDAFPDPAPATRLLRNASSLLNLHRALGGDADAREFESCAEKLLPTIMDGWKGRCAEATTLDEMKVAVESLDAAYTDAILIGLEPPTPPLDMDLKDHLEGCVRLDLTFHAPARHPAGESMDIEVEARITNAPGTLEVPVSLPVTLSAEGGSVDAFEGTTNESHRWGTSGSIAEGSFSLRMAAKSEVSLTDVVTLQNTTYHNVTIPLLHRAHVQSQEAVARYFEVNIIRPGDAATFFTQLGALNETGYHPFAGKEVVVEVLEGDLVLAAARGTLDEHGTWRTSAAASNDWTSHATLRTFLVDDEAVAIEVEVDLRDPYPRWATGRYEQCDDPGDYYDMTLELDFTGSGGAEDLVKAYWWSTAPERLRDAREARYFEGIRLGTSLELDYKGVFSRGNVVYYGDYPGKSMTVGLDPGGLSTIMRGWGDECEDTADLTEYER